MTGCIDFGEKGRLSLLSIILIVCAPRGDKLIYPPSALCTVSGGLCYQSSTEYLPPTCEIVAYGRDRHCLGGVGGEELINRTGHRKKWELKYVKNSFVSCPAKTIFEITVWTNGISQKVSNK